MGQRLEIFVCLVCLVGCCAVAEPGAPPVPPEAAPGEAATASREQNRETVMKAYEKDLVTYKGDTNRLVLPGLLADRQAREIHLAAEATGLKGAEPVEFLLISEESGHAYEALAVSFAKPGDVHAALRFIGMEPGKPVNRRELRFWPKGERVVITVSWPGADSPRRPVRIEELMFDDRTGKPLPPSGLVFVGSAFVDSREEPGKRLYAADMTGPHAIASAYNEPTTVLDVPRQASQTEVYNHQYANAQFRLPAGGLLDITMRPEYPANRKRVMDLRLSARRRAGEAGTNLVDAVFELRESGGEKLNRKTGINGVLEILATATEQQRDPFVTLSLGPDLTLNTVHRLCAILSSVETDTGIRMEPPLPGHLYYRAFLPDEQFRNRAERIAQPWELRLTLKENAVKGTLTQITQTWKDNELNPDLAVKHYDVPTREALRKELDAHEGGLPVILVFADAAMTHAQLMGFLEPVRDTHPTIHVYVEE